MGGRSRWISEFEASLDYKVSSRTARAIQRNPVLKNETKRNETKRNETKRNGTKGKEKERKGKERKGKERKGKERKGKERKKWSHITIIKHCGGIARRIQSSRPTSAM